MTRVLKAVAREDGTAVFDLPPDIAPGTELSLSVEDAPPRPGNGAELLAELEKAGFVGDWADRLMPDEEPYRKMTGAEIIREFGDLNANRDDLPNNPEEFVAWRKRISERQPS